MVTTIDAATGANGEFRAGGTDLQERIRSGIATRAIIDIQFIADLDRIVVGTDGATIGTLARIEDIGADPAIRRAYPALALVAQEIATPQIRAMATMGGSLCQRTRCWYYRHPDLGCPKKGNAPSCAARPGNHHFGVCFDLGPCVHPHPSSIACALLTYGAEVEVVGRGRMTIAELLGDGTDGTRDHQLEDGELITQVYLPSAAANERAAYTRQMSRAAADWPLVEVVVRLLMDAETIREARIGIGGVATIPFRLLAVESELQGQAPTPTIFDTAARRSIDGAMPLPQTGYKLDMVVGSVRHALERAAANENRSR